MVLKRLDPMKGQSIEISKLHPTTRRNLELLEEALDIDWTSAYRFPVKGQNTSFLIVGRGPTGEDIRYARVETRNTMAGQTSVYIDGKKFSVFHLLEKLEGRTPMRWIRERLVESIPSFPLEFKVDPKSFEEKIREKEEPKKLKRLGVASRAIKYYAKLLPQVKWIGEPKASTGNFPSELEGVSDQGERVKLEGDSRSFGRVLLEGQQVLDFNDLVMLKKADKIPNKFLSISDLVDIREDAKSSLERVRMEQSRLRESRPRLTHNVESGQDYYNKYLKGLERPNELYHITSRENLASIRARGLDIGLDENEKRWMGPLETVTSSYFYSRGRDPIILRIDLDKLDKSKLKSEDYSEGSGVQTYRGVIPPEAISEVRIPDFEV